MKILFTYLKEHWKLGVLALILAAINQIFSLLDPYITGKMINKFGVHMGDYADKQSQFVKDISFFLLASISVAMISRIAKNFQDYFTNVIIQKTGARMYTDG